MADLQPLSIKQWLVTLDGVTGYFTKATAPKATKGEVSFNDGSTGIERTHLDFIKYEKITISKPYDPAADGSLIEWANTAFEEGTKFTVTMQPVKADQLGSPIDGAKTIAMAECQLASFKYPEVDRGGSGLSMLELELIPGTITVQ